MYIYGIINEYLRNGHGGILATVIKRTGSAPRDVGTKMFMGDDGKVFGTIGGGRVEAEVREETQLIMNKGVTKVLCVYTDTQITEDQEMTCGGDLEVLLEPVTRGQLDVYQGIEAFGKSRRRGLVITKFRNHGLTKSLVDRDMKTIGDTLAEEMMEFSETLFHEKKLTVMDGVLIDPIQLAFPLYLFGAGHVSRYVSMIAKIAEFDVTVIDDREQYANRERFPDADVIIAGDFQDAFGYLDFTGNEYVVIVSRSHETDEAYLHKALLKPSKYIGMIGSKRKVKAIFDHLKEKGFTDTDMERVHSPIGIPIDAETPQEIAVSIVAELIQARAGT